MTPSGGNGKCDCSGSLPKLCTLWCNRYFIFNRDRNRTITPKRFCHYLRLELTGVDISCQIHTFSSCSLLVSKQLLREWTWMDCSPIDIWGQRDESHICTPFLFISPTGTIKSSFAREEEYSCQSLQEVRRWKCSDVDEDSQEEGRHYNCYGPIHRDLELSITD